MTIIFRLKRGQCIDDFLNWGKLQDMTYEDKFGALRLLKGIRIKIEGDEE